jgi:hypothetical protein
MLMTSDRGRPQTYFTWTSNVLELALLFANTQFEHRAQHMPQVKVVVNRFPEQQLLSHNHVGLRIDSF